MDEIKAINLFKEILHENWKHESDEFIRVARENNYHASDNVESTNEVDADEEESDDLEDVDNDDSDEVESDREDPGEIDLSKALDYGKLKSVLNQFRASHSLRDKEVNRELKLYFNRLSDTEKQLLYLFIKGLTQVTLLDISGKTAHVPADMQFSIAKTGATSREKEKSKERAQQASKDADSEEISNMTNTPITTIGGESHNESIKEILKIVKENA